MLVPSVNISGQRNGRCPVKNVNGRRRITGEEEMGKKDYILRSKAIKAVTGWETDPTDEELEMALSNVPSADVVKVVRCKDCKHNPMRSFTGYPMAGIEKRKPTDYCSYGVRKDG